VTSVAREAGLSRATVHRLEAVHERIRQLRREAPLANRKAAAGRVSPADRVAELQTQVQNLLEENLALTIRLARVDPSF